jgi:uncharacterized protein
MEKEKEDLLLGFLTNQIALLPALAAQYTKGNHNRISFVKLKQFADNFLNLSKEERIILMPGLRGIGKTTLLFQLYDGIKDRVKQTNLIYLSCDIISKQLNSTLYEVLEVYEKKILNTSFELLEEKTVILIDETHYDENWQSTIKSIFDRSKNVFLVISGSSSIAIEINTDLTRRMNIERIYPLNFAEYLLLKKGIFPIPQLGNNLRIALFLTPDIDASFRKLTLLNEEVTNKLRTKIPNLTLEVENFLSTGGFPFTLPIQKDEMVFSKIASVLDKVIYQDMVSFYPSCKSSLEKIFPLLHVLAEATDKVSYESILKFIPESSKFTVSEIMNALVRAGVIQGLSVEGSAAKMARNSYKYYFATPTIRSSLLWMIGKFTRDSKTIGLLFENAVFNTLNKIMIYSPNTIQNIYYIKEDGRPDFKIVAGDKKMFVECGWGNKYTKQITSLKEPDIKFSLIISDVPIPRLDKENKIIFVPRELFLLSS